MFYYFVQDTTKGLESKLSIVIILEIVCFWIQVFPFRDLGYMSSVHYVLFTRVERLHVKMHRRLHELTLHVVGEKTC